MPLPPGSQTTVLTIRLLCSPHFGGSFFDMDYGTMPFSNPPNHPNVVFDNGDSDEVVGSMLHFLQGFAVLFLFPKCACSCFGELTKNAFDMLAAFAVVRRVAVEWVCTRLKAHVGHVLVCTSVLRLVTYSLPRRTLLHLGTLPPPHRPSLHPLPHPPPAAPPVQFSYPVYNIMMRVVEHVDYFATSSWCNNGTYSRPSEVVDGRQRCNVTSNPYSA